MQYASSVVLKCEWLCLNYQIPDFWPSKMCSILHSQRYQITNLLLQGIFAKVSPIRADWTSTVSVCLWFLSLSSDPHPSRWIISPNHTPTFPPSVCLVTSTLPPIFGLNFRFPTEFWQKFIFLSLSFQPPTLIFTHWSTAYSNHYTTICLDWIWIFT